MIKLGLKLWSTNKHYVAEAVRLYEQAVYDYIELTAVPGSFADCASVWVGLKNSLNISFVIHAPHFMQKMNLADAACFGNNTVLLQETLQFADCLDGQYVIFHPGIGGKIEETARQLKLLYDARILIENKPYFVPGGLVCNGYSPEEIQFIMQETGVGFCLDAGHAINAANAQGIEQINYLKKFLELKPHMFHLTDGDWHGMYDKHDHLGSGSFKLKDIVSLYPADGRVTLETVHDFQDSLRDFEDDVAYMRMLEKQRENENFYIVPACKTDIELVFNLANDTVVRQQSIDGAMIEWDTHVHWFEQKLQDSTSIVYVARSMQHEFVGVVRFDRKHDQYYVVSISMEQAFRGKGIGTKLIQQATTFALSEMSSVQPIVAYIKPENIASRKSFQRAGYRDQGMADILGLHMCKMVYGDEKTGE